MSTESEDPRYHVLDHTADLGVELTAPTLEAAFSVAATAMFELMGTPQTLEGPAVEIEVTGDGIDREDLLVGTLSELLAALELDGHYLVGVPRVAIAAPQADGELWTCHLHGRARTIDRSRERSLIEIKAVTYHELTVEPDDDGQGWFLRVIFDL